MRVLVWVSRTTWRACVDAAARMVHDGSAAEVTLLHVPEPDAPEAAHAAFTGLLGRRRHADPAPVITAEARVAGGECVRAGASVGRDGLRARADDAATIVYHSVFLQYPPREARHAIVETIREAGERATAKAPFAWVRLEPEALTDGVENSPRMVIDITTWPGAQRRIIGHTDGHVRAVYAV